MRLILVVVAAAALLTENLALPVGKEGQREDVLTRCLVDILSKALSKPDSQLDQECKEILQAGVKHAPLEKKRAEGMATHDDMLTGHPEEPEAKGADMKDIEALLKSVEEKREMPEDERSQESWSLGDEKEKRHEGGEEEEREKRRSFRPRYQSRAHKRGEEEDNERSQESWSLGDEKEKRHEGGEEEEREKRRSFRPRYQSRAHKRGEEEDNERSQESWSLGDEKEKRHEGGEEEEREKRRSYRPRYQSRAHKRGEEEDNERSQESWGLEEKRSGEEGEDRERRNWRPGRYHQRKHKRDEEPLGGEGEEPEEERSQESWDVDKRHGNEDEGGSYKGVWKPTHSYHHETKVHKRDEEEEDNDRSQEYWGLGDERDKREWRAGRYHQRRHKRDEELSEEPREEPDEERSQEYWDFDTGRDKREWRAGRYHQRRHKRDEELSEEPREEPDEERSQEYWDFDTGRDKREWRAGRYHQRRHKRDEELSEERRDEADEERSQESWGLDKRNGNDEEEIKKRLWKPAHRYRHKSVLHKRGGGSSEEEEGDSEEDEEAAPNRADVLRYLAEKRNPWIFRGYYHPAWFKRDSDEHTASSNKMDELAQLLSYKMNLLAGHSNQEEAERSTRQRVLNAQEEKELENLAAMDMELQKIAAKLHENSA